MDSGNNSRPRGGRIEDVESLVIEGSHYVRIRCEDGTTGLGQSAAWAYPKAVDAVVQEFRPYLLGQDAGRIEHHWQHLYRMGPFRGSILGGALSAVDIALWDIKGKRLGAPVWELLGGRCRDRIPLFLLLDSSEGPDGLAAQARAAAGEGFPGVKLDPLPDGYQDMALPRLCAAAADRVGAVREAVGLDVELILELHRKLSPLMVAAVAQAIRPFQPLFLEDPIQIDSIVATGDLARKLPDPFANGERLNTIWEFRELLAHGGAQYVRPDPGLAGGITHTKKIAAVAEAHHAILCPHCFFGPVLTAACVHIDASVPNFVLQEYAKVTNEGRFANALTGRVRRERGMLIVPEGPGLGLELDPSKAVPARPAGWRLQDTPLRSDGSVALAR